jgi:hypothetical protein
VVIVFSLGLFLNLTYCCRLQIGQLLAFTNGQLQPCLASGFLLEFMQHVYVEKFEVSTCLSRILPATSRICRHTDIAQICRAKDGDQFQVLQYTWAHDKFRPWGNSLPVQCPNCGTLRSWIFAEGENQTRLFACKSPSCSKKLVFRRPEQVEWFGGEVTGGRWMVQRGI